MVYKSKLYLCLIFLMSLSLLRNCLGDEKETIKLGLRNNTNYRSQNRSTRNDGNEDENILRVEARKFLKQCGSKRNDSENENNYDINFNQGNGGSVYDSRNNDRNSRNSNRYGSQNWNSQYNQGSQNTNRYKQGERFNQRQNFNYPGMTTPYGSSNQNYGGYPDSSNYNSRRNNYGAGNPYAPQGNSFNYEESQNNNPYNGYNGYSSGSNNNQRTSQCGPNNNDRNYGRNNNYNGNNNDDANRNPYNMYNMHRLKRYNHSDSDDKKDDDDDDDECVSQCIFGYLQLLDEDRTPSESMVIKWLQDHISGSDINRIKALRDARRCFARLITTDTEDGCEFSTELAKCLELHIE
ncbi:probable serine/threonine-protein kinase clkA isoform X2 [Sitophilus oryzae]|uniref:Probable serine/threonine-protein kinase clkA isoform X2 n=1 Tax=Sitophilus oryzae TaxID=7048 RepID=A0A6J2YB66_SITOR|nr:probable serine/threonine-protein kinase clkA isoform X2 [Sitophilus oryzae]